MFSGPRPEQIERLKKKIAEHKLAQEKLRTYQQQLRRLIGELVLAEERERRRIAVFLCNGFCQDMASLRMGLETLRQSARSAELAGTLEEMLESTKKMIQDVRSLAFDLSPPILYELGLEPTIKWLVEKAQAQQDITATFQDDAQDKPLDEAVRLGLFRVIRELLANVAKHARAQHIKVSARKDGSDIRIQVEDDGTGFDLAEVQARRDSKVGFGLLLLSELLDHFGGSIRIDSKPGRGTRVTLVAPLKTEQKHSSGESILF